jgi:hypothetical protein
MEKRFTALRIISVFYKIMGVIIGIGAILGAVFAVIAQPVVDLGFGKPNGSLVLIFAVIMAVIVLVFGGLAAFGTYALGDLITLLMNIEENTRFTALIIRDRMQPAQQMPPAAPQVMARPMQPPMQPPAPPPSIQVPPPPVQPPSFQAPPPPMQPPSGQTPPPPPPPVQET